MATSEFLNATWEWDGEFPKKHTTFSSQPTVILVRQSLSRLARKKRYAHLETHNEKGVPFFSIPPLCYSHPQPRLFSIMTKSLRWPIEAPSDSGATLLLTWQTADFSLSGVGTHLSWHCPSGTHHVGPTPLQSSNWSPWSIL